MIKPGKLASGFDPDDVVRLLDHTDHLAVAAGIAAEQAKLALADVVANAAENNSFFYIEYRLREMLRVLAGRAEDMERQPLCGFLANPRQALELGDQSG